MLALMQPSMNVAHHLPKHGHTQIGVPPIGKDCHPFSCPVPLQGSSAVDVERPQKVTLVACCQLESLTDAPWWLHCM